MIGPAELGSTWRNMIRPGPAPRQRAASTNSRSRRARNDPRTRREVLIQRSPPMTSTMVRGLVPKRVASRIRTKIVGRQSMKSTTRIRALSSQPPW